MVYILFAIYLIGLFFIVADYVHFINQNRNNEKK